ncbi:MAG TPA: rRNA pseudouridine synthase [Candidatus Faecousia faecigallinarum]|nr:rRNA pseudouridine synthase [Candidatus Faecousia faecigallinarum]
MRERLQKLLSARGIASRRQAEQMIAQGRVLVNGRPAALGDRADPAADEITVDGRRLPPARSFVYIMLNKPRGVVTTLSDEKGRKNAAQLVSGCGCRVWPVGRLDMDSEGLLLFTNDGSFSQAVAHPRGRVDKHYRVWVQGYGPDRLAALARPVVLDGYQIAKPEIRLLHAQGGRACLAVTIHEGRNRQIRRMCAMAGMGVTRLVRLGEGKLTLGSLKPGQWRYLTPAEVAGVLEQGGNHG